MTDLYDTLQVITALQRNVQKTPETCYNAD